MLVTTLNQYTKKICKETFLDDNSETALLEWVTVAKSQMIENLSTNMEAWGRYIIGHKGRLTRSKNPPTGTVDLCFIVKLIVNDIKEVVKRFLMAAEDKEKDQAAKKIVKTI